MLLRFTLGESDAYECRIALAPFTTQILTYNRHTGLGCWKCMSIDRLRQQVTGSGCYPGGSGGLRREENYQMYPP